VTRTLVKLKVNIPITHVNKHKVDKTKNSFFITSLENNKETLRVPKNNILNKFTEYTAPKIILVNINKVKKNPITVCKEDLNANNSPQKLSDPGIEILANVNIRNNEHRIGIETNKPLYTLITLE